MNNLIFILWKLDCVDLGTMFHVLLLEMHFYLSKRKILHSIKLFTVYNNFFVIFKCIWEDILYKLSSILYNIFVIWIIKKIKNEKRWCIVFKLLLSNRKRELFFNKSIHQPVKFFTPDYQWDRRKKVYTKLCETQKREKERIV